MDDNESQKLEQRGFELPYYAFTNMDAKFVRYFKIRNENLCLRVGDAKDKSGERIRALLLQAGNSRQVLHTVNLA
jgi:hypothetical protein